MVRRWYMLSLGVRLAILLVAGFGALGALEWWAREYGDKLPHWGLPDLGSEVLTAHETRLWGLAPGERENGKTTSNVSQIGLRGTPPTQPRSQGEERIVILGDSTHFGHGVSDSQTIASLLEQGLHGATVINGGVPGYSTEQTRRLLDEVIWGLEPTLLILGNFWSDTNFEPFSDRDLLATRDAEMSAVLIRSALLRLIATQMSNLLPRDEGRIITWSPDSTLPEASRRRVNLIDYVGNLEGMIRDAAERNVGALLLSPPAKVETTLAVRPPHQWTSYKEHQRMLADHYGIPYIDASEVFAADHKDAPSPSAENLFIDDLHPSVRGNELIASQIKAELRASGWPLMRLIGADVEPIDGSDLVDTTPQDRVRIEAARDDSPLMGMFLADSVVTNEPENNGAPMEPDSTQSEDFSITIEATAGTGPFQVQIRHEGRIVAGIRAKKTGNFPIRIANDTLPAIITASNAKGQQVKQVVHDLRSTAVLRLP